MVYLELGLVLFVRLGSLWALSIWRLMHFSFGDICMNYFINDFSPLHFSILHFCNFYHLLLKLYTAPLLLLSFTSCFLQFCLHFFRYIFNLFIEFFSSGFMLLNPKALFGMQFYYMFSSCLI